ncbi:unnamed protein product [Brassicogethes aeneus]|uniref:E3 ubiquitin-protein ligase n=1 Tax=Brassicogethes aeneus TaxID=1431903 RepID=A0A9P0BEC7_BRAAE|nr:unnamed protein product [Brassicogethes aeneus]
MDEDIIEEIEIIEEVQDESMTFDDSFDSKAVISSWAEKLHEGTLSKAHFEEFWKQWVSKIISPSVYETHLSWSYSDEAIQKVLISPLEEFIFDGVPSEVLSKLLNAEKAQSVCGRVFKMGEPTYSCRECGMDGTCVLCVDCFKNSAHRYHKYRMGQSGGGGCCDCGDTEAWKKDPFCQKHSVDQDEEDRLPGDVLGRTRAVFDAVLWYAFRLLNTDLISDIRLGSSSEDFYSIDNYCTILYNDEVHTFEQVITTLTRVLKCTQRVAIEYVTNIDREGRSIVKCASFQNCCDLKDEIEKYTSRHGSKPLKVLVNHTHIIGRQMFALKVLTWLQTFLGHGKEFRAVFAEVILKPQPNEPCLLKGILERDAVLWKNARSHWHRLLISGMLLEYENKKAFAKIFTKNYGQVVKDFIKDDHDHAFSISSMSVQLFTVPTLAHHLIEHEDVFYILMNTLMSECGRKCNKNGKLEFERAPHVPNPSFKRALYTLFDLRYLLSSIPEVWTDELKKRFLHGLSMLLNLLAMMQGMDAATRQVGQHMEYEPEWETGFNLHIKLSHCISLVLQWCATDEVVLVKAYRATLKKLEESPCYDPNEAGKVRELADHGTACLHYDVATKPVSIHLPLSRFLAGLYVYIEKFNLHTKVEFQVPKPSPVQIIEPVLRAQVMIAQVHAGMWRRNGYALLNTLFFYHNVRCRTEMLDRDINLLQVGASLIESNEFLIHVLNKCNLINWAMPNFEEKSLKAPEEDSVRQTINLVEEMLHLLIIIIGERFVPGIADVTVEERIKKELIQHLCIRPLPHSELIKSIPEDLCHDTAPDELMQQVATFKKSGTGSGTYELKPDYFEQYNIFFYHYTREELSKSEESQRTRRKAAGQLECCPPPKLLKLRPPFIMLANLLQCDVMLYLMETVLKRCIDLRARSFSESQLHKVLHLIGYALHEEQSQHYEYFRFVENSHKFKIFALLEELLNCRRVDAHKDLLKWTINKFKEVAKLSTSEDSAAGKSTDGLPVAAADGEKERRAKLAAERRAKLMAQMTAAQNNFMKENAKLFKENNMEAASSNATSATCIDPAMEVSECDKKPVALGPSQSSRAASDLSHTCILCQEEAKVRPDGPTLVLAAFVQQATVLCQHKNNDYLMDVTKHDPLFLHANLGPAPHTSTCGHVMHGDCWRKYFENIMLRENRRHRLRHASHASFDVEKQEFLCPLCECLSNTILPLVPALSVVQPDVIKSRVPFETYISGIKAVLKRKNKICHGIFKCNVSEECKNIHCEACHNATNGTSLEPDVSPECEANCTFQPYQVYLSCPVDSFDSNSDALPKDFVQLFANTAVLELDTDIQEMIRLFTQATYTKGLNVHPHPSDSRLAPMAWKSLAYTIHSVEVLLRDSQKPLLGHLSSRQRDCLENLVRLVGVLGGTLPPKGVVISSHCLVLLSILFEHGNEGPSILQWDSLGFLVSLTYSLPSLSSKQLPTPSPTGGTLEMHTLRLIFASHIVKILILLDLELLDDSMDTDESEVDGDYTGLNEVLLLMNKTPENLSLASIWNQVQYACLPFLRCCVLFYHYLTDVAPPRELTEQNGATFAHMCDYLALPQQTWEIFSSHEVMSLAAKWCHHEEVQLYLSGTPLQVVHEPLPINRLIELPPDYSELINMVSSFVCPNSEEDSRNPTMCLVCGELLCSQSYCCQTEVQKTNVGACNYHAHKCGAGVGIFLRVRECEILFLASPLRGCLVSSPYLDDYGETDQGLRRGNPLRLCHERYQKLQTLWLKHSIHEEIARAIESSNHPVSMQWALL